MPVMMATPPASRACVGAEHMHLSFYFTDLIFMVYQSTAKTMKLDPLKFPAIQISRRLLRGMAVDRDD